MKVLKVGFEPTCNQLPFLQGISLRGYISIADARGIEPITYWLTANCSTIELCVLNVIYQAIQLLFEQKLL